MTTLRVLDEGTGTSLGAISRADDGAINAEGLGQDIFDQIKNGKGWDEQTTFDALADGGWSNGYVTVKSATQS